MTNCLRLLFHNYVSKIADKYYYTLYVYPMDLFLTFVGGPPTSSPIVCLCLYSVKSTATTVSCKYPNVRVKSNYDVSNFIELQC